MSKFRKGQVVMIRDGVSSYPVKLDRLTTIGEAEEDGLRWFDTLGNVEYEKRMRPLTTREIALRSNPAAPGGGK